MKRDASHHILITGATSGIGLEVTKLLAEKGFIIHGVSRSGSCETFSHPSVTFYPMNVTETDSVEKALTRIALNMEGEKSFSAVIHCAGYGIAGSALDTPLAAVKDQFETNYFGVLRVNELLFAQGMLTGSRIIVLGSVAGRISIPFQSHYSSSKFALEAYVEALRLETHHTGITATIIEAGDTKTHFTANRSYHAPEVSPFREKGKKAVAKMEKDEQNGHHPSVVAKTVYRALRKRRMPVRMVVGASYSALMILKRLLPDAMAELIVRLLYLS